ncbi:unnamed protein product [Oppiella nova]|uniref:NADH-cytochrome b5 reductase n=1 Tax=Oppiella nova TaxID=334625 RepID=A0A7R9LTV3_9ACAR|nr:unnamed protein product [Oppiella nova]CAG2166948.1 unnamed protein product [Oppiella nova]
MDFNNTPLVVSLLAISGTTLFILYKLFSKKSNPRFLVNPEEKYWVPLIEREDISHDTRRFRFGLPSDQHILGLPVGQHIFLTAHVNNQLVIRAYTPVSSDDDQGFFDLVVKVYFSNTHPKFPEGGKMSQYLEAMKIGDKMQIRGPNGLLEYKGRGKLSVKPDKKKPPVLQDYKKIGMIAGGTGITPCLQLIRQVFKDQNDRTDLWLLYANQSADDILLRKELEEVAKEQPNRFHLWYTVDRPETDWKYSSGFINSDMIREHLPAPADDTCILMCGPPPMINFACNPNLDKLGHPNNKRFVY